MTSHMTLVVDTGLLRCQLALVRHCSMLGQRHTHSTLGFGPVDRDVATRLTPIHTYARLRPGPVCYPIAIRSSKRLGRL